MSMSDKLTEAFAAYRTAAMAVMQKEQEMAVAQQSRESELAPLQNAWRESLATLNKTILEDGRNVD